jgi:glucose dehydrogenase
MNKGIFITLIGFIAFACTSAKKEKHVTEDALLNAASDGTEWLTYGSNYSETRFSKLLQISDRNIKE